MRNVIIRLFRSAIDIPLTHVWLQWNRMENTYFLAPISGKWAEQWAITFTLWAKPARRIGPKFLCWMGGRSERRPATTAPVNGPDGAPNYF